MKAIPGLYERVLCETQNNFCFFYSVLREEQKNENKYFQLSISSKTSIVIDMCFKSLNCHVVRMSEGGKLGHRHLTKKTD